jgi:hypothetical protein
MKTKNQDDGDSNPFRLAVASWRGHHPLSKTTPFADISNRIARQNSRPRILARELMQLALASPVSLHGLQSTLRLTAKPAVLVGGDFLKR